MQVYPTRNRNQGILTDLRDAKRLRLQTPARPEKEGHKVSDKEYTARQE